MTAAIAVRHEEGMGRSAGAADRQRGSFPLEYKGRCPRWCRSSLVYWSLGNNNALTDDRSSPAAPRAQGSCRERERSFPLEEMIDPLASCPLLPLHWPATRYVPESSPFPFVPIPTTGTKGNYVMAEHHQSRRAPPEHGDCPPDGAAPARKFPSLPVLEEGAKETINTPPISEAPAVAQRQQSS
jgi:hypothetical protein